jgi:hypothetical protein
MASTPCKIPPWRRWYRWPRTSKSGPRRADERKTAAAGAPSGEDQREPSSRCLAVLDALPEGEQIDLGITDGDAGKQRWGAG